MIYKLNPSDLDSAIELLSQMDPYDVAEKFDVTVKTLRSSIKQYCENGIKAFSSRMIVDWQRTNLIDKTLDECHEYMKTVGWDGDRKKLCSELSAMKVNYKKTSCNALQTEYKGVKGLENICKAHGVSKSTVEHRMYNQGMTLEMALEAKCMRPKYQLNGLKGLPAIATHYGVSYTALAKKVNTGFSVKHAVDFLLSKKA